MTKRTFKKSITFQKPAILRGYSKTLPAGTYTFEIEEELLESFSFTAYRATQATLLLPADHKHPGRTEWLIILPSELESAIKRDKETGSNLKKLFSANNASLAQKVSDQKEIDRAENEGMAIPAP